MNTKLRWLLGTSAGACLLGGCCTSQPAREWEYKVIAGNANANVPSSVETQQALLNDQAKRGWTFIQTEGGWFYFKRPKR